MSRSPLTPDELARLARLARVGLDRDELQTLREDLSGILDYAESMRAASPAGDAGDVDARGCSTEPPFVFREDARHAWSGPLLEDLRAGHVVVVRVL